MRHPAPGHPAACHAAPLPPGSVIGILGAGQLGRMLTLAAARLGLRCHVYSDASGPAFDTAAATVTGPFEDEAALTAFAKGTAAVTYEFENIPLSAVACIERTVPVRPDSRALAVAQDRLAEKHFLDSLGLPVAPFAAVSGEADLAAALETLGLPVLLKTQRLGYDGKGQVRLPAAGDPAGALAAIGGGPAVAERELQFAHELSVLVVRSLSGEMRFYDVPVNTHEGGILKVSAVPAPLPSGILERAREMAGRIAAALGYVGVLAVEMFYLGEAGGSSGPLAVNEIAPRVHNSGHWTLDACAVSQFENHIRAVAGWPLGATGRHSDAWMENLLGADVHRWPELAAEPGVCLHLYGKTEARAGRKMGHLTRLSPRTA